MNFPKRTFENPILESSFRTSDYGISKVFVKYYSNENHGIQIVFDWLTCHLQFVQWVYDGNTAEAFHKKCDNKGATIVIAKVTNSEHIVGGYNPLQWDSSNKYKLTSSSFIFSFINRTNLQTAKVGHINDGFFKYSVYCYPNYGPTFGNGHDLFQYKDTIWRSYNVFSYPKIDIPENPNSDYYSYNDFNVEDYEVFQVIEK